MLIKMERSKIMKNELKKRITVLTLICSLGISATAFAAAPMNTTPANAAAINEDPTLESEREYIDEDGYLTHEYVWAPLGKARYSDELMIANKEFKSYVASNGWFVTHRGGYVLTSPGYYAARAESTCADQQYVGQNHYSRATIKNYGSGDSSETVEDDTGRKWGIGSSYAQTKGLLYKSQMWMNSYWGITND